MCKLKKAIYGLKQSLRAGFDKFSRTRLDFQKCYSHHSIFIRSSSGAVILIVYVDYLLTESDVDGI